MDIVLIAGLWLPNSIWTEVASELEHLGHRPIPVLLPGVDDESTVATLEEQVEAVVATVDRCQRPMVVGHSAACTLAWIAADRRPEQVAMVALIGGFPGADGEIYADFFETTDGVMPFPGWEPFEGADSVDLDDDMRRQISTGAVPVPEGVSRGVVRLTDDRRFDVPVLVICPEFTARQAQAWIEAGDVPELAKASRKSYADIDTGHWPMVSAPEELARVIGDAGGE